MSVPKKPSDVKNALESALDGLLKGHNVEGDYLGVESVGEMSGDALVELFKVLMKAGNKSAASTRFRIGDVYNKMGRESPSARRIAMRRISDEFNDNERQTFRTYGWVASKWPRDKRDDKNGWTYFIRNAPGVTVPPRVIKAQELKIIAAIQISGGKQLILEDKWGKRFKSYQMDSCEYGAHCPQIDDGGNYVNHEINSLIESGDITEDDRIDAFAERELVEA